MTKELKSNKILDNLLENFIYAEDGYIFKDNPPSKDGTCFEDDGNIHYTYKGKRYCLYFGQEGNVKGMRKRVINYFNSLKKGEK